RRQQGGVAGQRGGARGVGSGPRTRGAHNFGGDGAGAGAAGRGGRAGVGGDSHGDAVMTPDIVVDIGNTHIKWGLCGPDGIRNMARLDAKPRAWDDCLTLWRREYSDL